MNNGRGLGLNNSVSDAVDVAGSGAGGGGSLRGGGCPCD